MICQKKNRTTEEISSSNADTVDDTMAIEPVEMSAFMCTSHASISEIEVSEVLCEEESDGKYSQRSLHCWAIVLAMTSTLVMCAVIGPAYDQSYPAYIRR